MRIDITQALILVLGFFTGVALAMLLTPGDVWMWIATGVVLGWFCHLFFSAISGGSIGLQLVGTSSGPSGATARRDRERRHTTIGSVVKATTSPSYRKSRRCQGWVNDIRRRLYHQPLQTYKISEQNGRRYRYRVKRHDLNEE